MKDRYVAAIAIAAFAVGTGLAVYSVRSQSDSCPQPWALSVTALFAPCEALYGALDHAISEPEILRVGLLISDDHPAPTSDEQPAPPATLLASRLAESVDPFFHQSGG
jgi:hypothetical protein